MVATRFIIILLLAPACYVFASPYTPTSDDTVLVDWGEAIGRSNSALTGPKLAPEKILQKVNRQLTSAGRPGQAYRYRVAKSTLAPLIKNPPQKIKTRLNFWLTWARIQQHLHFFEQALNSLDKVFAINPVNINAQLMAARILIVRGRPLEARKHCATLMGHSDLMTASACLLETTSYTQSLSDSYRQLKVIVDKQGFPNDSRSPWLAQMLASMALRLGKPRASAEWLKTPKKNATVSYLGQWADTQIALHHNRKVLELLGPYEAKSNALDDALLLRLAIAEKTTGSNNHWQKLMAERVALRESRNEHLHAFDVARYYLDVKYHPKRALKWAQINAKFAREHRDTALLKRAQKAMQKVSAQGD